MCPSPSHAPSSRALNQTFVGRRAELGLFEGMLSPAGPLRYQVLNLYGVGGQGKTALLNQFAARLKSPDCRERPVCRLDFSIPHHRVPVEGLYALRNQLRQQRVPTHAFDVAFARHFAESRPGRDLKRDCPELYRFPEDSLFGELVDIGAEAVREIPGGKLAVTLLARLSNHVSRWYQTRGIEILARLEGLSAQQIADELPMFLGYDLSDFLARHPRRRPVFLLDTHEALWRETGGATSLGNDSGDRWLRRLAEESPGCLMVVAGRRRIAWDEHDPDWSSFIVSRPLGALDAAEADEVLDAAGVRDPEIRAALRAVSAGHPLSLAMGIRYYQMRVQAGIAPRPEELPRTHRDILDRFFDHLEPSVRGLMRVLAVPRTIRSELWAHLARSEFPAFDLYAPTDILGEVFFSSSTPNEHTMHERVREHLLGELERKDPDLLRRARLAVFDFYDRAGAADAAARHGSTVPDLAGSFRTRDECLAEAASQLILAAPERYIQWCDARLSEDRRGSTHRAELVEMAGRALGEIGQLGLLDAAILARLKVAVDPWSPDSVELVKLVSDVGGATTPPQAVITELNTVAKHLRAANPEALPPSLVEMLRRVGGDSIPLALAADDLAVAIHLVEQDFDKKEDIRAQWDELVVIARARRADLAQRLGDSFRSKTPDDPWWAMLAQSLDTFNYCDAPELGPVMLARALGEPDYRAACEAVLQLPPSILSHQVTLCLYESLIRCGHASTAVALVDGRFDDAARQAFVESLRDLQSRGGGVRHLGSPEGKAFVDAFEQGHRVWGFLQGYLEAALRADAQWADRLEPAMRQTVEGEIARSYQVYRDLGGQPAVSTLRKNPFDLVRNDQSEILLLHYDPLLLWRSIDWIAFHAEAGFRFGDVRQGKNRSFRLLLEESVGGLEIGDGAALLVVLMNEQRQPILGEYVNFYGSRR